MIVSLYYWMAITEGYMRTPSNVSFFFCDIENESS